ncbi:unnamed protein product [Peronospora effusa]|nr:unnamed protein product [Peronospora effusa]
MWVCRTGFLLAKNPKSTGCRMRGSQNSHFNHLTARNSTRDLVVGSLDGENDLSDKLGSWNVHADLHGPRTSRLWTTPGMDAANIQHEDITRTEHETLHGTEGSTQNLDGPLSVSDGCERCMRRYEQLVPQGIVNYADPDMRMTMLSRLDIHRPDFLRQAEELAQFAQQVEIESHVKILGRDVVNAVETRKEPKERVTSRRRRNVEVSDQRACYKCEEVGHIRFKCPQARKKGAVGPADTWSTT